MAGTGDRARAVAQMVRRQATSELFIHAAIVALVVICATVLDALGKLQDATVTGVYGGAIAYSAGRSGSRNARRVSDAEGD